MKTILKIISLFLIISTLLFACDDFVEPNIDNETVNLLAPANNLTTIQLTHTFWWDFLEGAEVYNMQIVEGTFSAVTSLALDTIITDNKFDVTLYPGSFQWRVRGENNGGETDYTIFSFVIDSTLDISSLQVVLNSPSDNVIMNNTNVTLGWNSLLNADDYLIEAHLTTWAGTTVFGPQIENSTSLTTTLPEGVIVWGVQARNTASGTSSMFSTRTLTIDTTNPGAISLVTPVDNAVLSDIFNTYTWTQPADAGTDLTDDIYFYSDAAGTTLFKSAQATGTSYQDSLGVGTYYWAVQSTDAAGNIGIFSNLRRVVIQ